MAASSQRSVVRVSSDVRTERMDLLPAEEPVEFRLADTPIAVLMRTPGHDEELARGFALTEGIILRPSELDEVRSLPGEDGAGRYELIMAEGIEIDPEQFRRNLYATSSCGVCGKASIDSVRVAAPSPPSGAGGASGSVDRLHGCDGGGAVRFQRERGAPRGCRLRRRRRVGGDPGGHRSPQRHGQAGRSVIDAFLALG